MHKTTQRRILYNGQGLSGATDDQKVSPHWPKVLVIAPLKTINNPTTLSSDKKKASAVCRHLAAKIKAHSAQSIRKLISANLAFWGAKRAAKHD